MQDNLVISLFDKTGLMLEPWAEAGFNCINVDINQTDPHVEVWDSGGRAEFVRADVRDFFRGFRPYFVAAFPPCTDLTYTGRKHWPAKRKADPDFQKKAIELVDWTWNAMLASGARCVMENPPGILSAEWRPHHHLFDPYQYGGWCPPGPHPLYPRYWPEQDAYRKPTCLWSGGGFKVPTPRLVEPIKASANAFSKLGGASRHAADIRSATPRGFARAVFAANRPGL